MGFTKDRKFLVKEMTDGDHKSLEKFAEAYVTHLLKPGHPSLICRIYAHFKTIPTGGTKAKVFLAMGNCCLKSASCLYDLKGTNDDKTMILNDEAVKDVHKRIWNVHLWAGKTMWSKDRHIYHEGKIHAESTKFGVTQEICSNIKSMLKRDCDLLKRHKLMDYSLIVSTRTLLLHQAVEEKILVDNKLAPEFREVCAGKSFACFSKTRDGIPEVNLFCIGIIDFLQEWNNMKVLAKKVKFMEKNKSTIDPGPYGDRFELKIGDRFAVDALPVDADDDNAVALLASESLKTLKDAEALAVSIRRRGSHVYSPVTDVTWERMPKYIMNAAEMKETIPSLIPKYREIVKNGSSKSLSSDKPKFGHVPRSLFGVLILILLAPFFIFGMKMQHEASP